MAHVGVGAGRWMAIVAAGLMVFGSFAAAGADAASAILPCPKVGGTTEAVASIASLVPRPMNPCPGGEWAKTYGGAGPDAPRAVQATSDGGYVVLSRTSSFGAGDWDAWVVKLNATGFVEWENSYGGPQREWPNGIIQTSDGGYLMVGRTASFVGPAEIGQPTGDAWVVKLEATGEIGWQKSYGGTKYDDAWAVQQTTDGGFIIAGASSSHLRGTRPDPDAWLLKLDAVGTVVWQNVYGGKGPDCASSVRQTSDGGFIVAGGTFRSGDMDIWLLKAGATGNVIWQKAYGDPFWADGGLNCYSYWDHATVVIAPDGGYFVAATANWADGNYQAFKVDASGNEQWHRLYDNGNPSEHLSSAAGTSDGGYTLAGTSGLGDWTNDRPWVVKLDSSGSIEWQRTFGVYVAMDGKELIHQTADGYYVLAFSSEAGAGSWDAWVMRLYPSGDPGICPPGVGEGASGTASLVAPPVSTTKVSPQSTAAGSTTTSVAPASTSGIVIQQCFS